MAFTTALWRNDNTRLVELPRKRLDNEKRLEDWLAEDLGLRGRELLLIGRQIPTPAGRDPRRAFKDRGWEP